MAHKFSTVAVVPGHDHFEESATFLFVIADNGQTWRLRIERDGNLNKFAWEQGPTIPHIP